MPSGPKTPPLAKRFERDLCLCLGQIGGQGDPDVAVVALLPGSPLVKAFLGAVVFSLGLKIGGKGFAQRLGEVPILYPSVFKQVPVIPYSRGMGQEVPQGDRNLRVFGIPDGERKDLVDVPIERKLALLHQLHDYACSDWLGDRCDLKEGFVGDGYLLLAVSPTVGTCPNYLVLLHHRCGPSPAPWLPSSRQE